jgi:hypothetical protein
MGYGDKLHAVAMLRPQKRLNDTDLNVLWDIAAVHVKLSGEFQSDPYRPSITKRSNSVSKVTGQGLDDRG